MRFLFFVLGFWAAVGFFYSLFLSGVNGYLGLIDNDAWYYFFSFLHLVQAGVCIVAIAQGVLIERLTTYPEAKKDA